jgi:hypothetical protein
MENKMMEEVSEQAVQTCGKASTFGGKIGGLLLGALGVVGGILTVMFLKKKKAQHKNEEVVVESDETVVENNE